MVKIKITNASVSDSGYGLRVDGKDLEDIISEALGVKKYEGRFEANACDITVIIEPKESTFKVEREDGIFTSIEEMEAALHEHEETKETDTEE